MKIPRYWARAASAHPEDFPHPITAWGWSDQGYAEAEAQARRRLAGLEARLRQGQALPHGYAYGRGPLREEIVEEIHGFDGTLEGVVTRNSLGCLVVNAERALFVDVDLPSLTLSERLRRMFGGRKDYAAELLDRLRHALRASAATSFRLYRTAGGFRVLATNPPFTPGSAAAESLMQSAGADPAYIQLCRLQQSFRARLTPKPWRCGVPRVPGQFPREDAKDRQEFAVWLEQYHRACALKATCHFIEAIGPGTVHESIAPILRLHDDFTRANLLLLLA